MNTLFVIGNGFDINLGLHTGYQDFYDYYLNQPSGDETIIKLKKFLTEERYKTWADLELGLGGYTIQTKSIEELRSIYYDISDRLREYLKKEENSFSATKEITNAIISGLASPYSVLPLGMQNAISNFRANSQPYYVNVISFNYTNTLEVALNALTTSNGWVSIGPQTYLGAIRHIHMRLEDEDVIMGVNDDSQISNKDLLNNDLRGLLVKPFINRQLQNLIDVECQSLINHADLFCLFGVSVGETDSMWWRNIGTRFLQSTARIILFAHDNEKVTRNSDRIRKYTTLKSLLFSRMGIGEPSDDQINRVFIGYKTALFK